MKRAIAASLVTLVLFFAPPQSERLEAQSSAYAEALKLYGQALRGEKRTEDLTDEQRRLVLAVHRIVSKRKAERDEGVSSECREARSEARERAEELASYAKKLMRCAESELLLSC